MRILALSEHYRETLGGSASYVRNICHSLASVGHEVYLITEQDDTNSLPIEEWQFHDGYFRRSVGPNQELNGFTYRGRRALEARVKKSLPQLFSELNPNVVHVLYGNILARVLRSVPSSAARIYTIHNVPPHEYTFNHFSKHPLLNKMGRQLYFTLVYQFHRKTISNLPYHKLICNSNQTKKYAVDAGANSTRCEVVPMGVDVDVFVPLQLSNTHNKQKVIEGNPLILSVAGVNSTKGQIDVIEAMPEILTRFPRAQYVNLGAVREQPYLELLKARISSLGLEEHCQLLGHVSSEELLIYYNACDLYVQPSHEEGFCIAALQAISCGKPVVGTNVGAMPEFIEEGRAGIVIPFGHPSEISRSIIQLLDSETRQNKQAQHDYVVANYSWDAVAKKTADLYGKVLNG